ncbi:MAG TPA: helix-turn-helix domain-containing protein [Eoetvoesiella sp.]|uniref:helix-turn-helix domain-containing protein n=1 Tax=Eoetvoesiella sp. TaxID=1966355 RepID=UPI002B744C8D|nr:helix-turn-helix domain-containing protein [Eoetvoesiella sp.]HWK61937.1 helix-turn-helix domain-containing protein [Eoetvoesiella sp.]
MFFSEAVSPSPHILIVEDNPDQLRLLIETLRSSDFRLSVAFDGLQGYDRALASQPDLILLDVRMPRLDGFALCRRLKANPATAGIPVVFLSAADDLSERLIGLRDGGVDYILKPFESEEVIARIRIHLGLTAKDLLDDACLSAEHLNEEEVLVRAAQSQLLANLSQTPRLDELAERLGVSEKRLSRAFRRCLNMTVFQYLRNQRMRTAQRLLTETSLSMVAISEEVGFTSAANFSTAFREHTGVSPSDYRRGDAPGGFTSTIHDS